MLYVFNKDYFGFILIFLQKERNVRVNRTKCKTKNLLCALLILCLGICSISFSMTAKAEDIDSLQSQLNELEEKNKKYEDELKKTQDDINKKEDYIDTLVEKIGLLGEKIGLTNESIDELNESIEEKQNDIDLANENIDESIDVLCERLKIVYMAGNASDLEIILGAKDFSDFIDKTLLVKKLSDYDKNLINDLNQNLDKISDQKSLLEDDKQKLEEQEESLQSDLDDLNDLLDENKEALDELYKANGDAEDAIKQAELESKEINDKITQYYKDLAQSSSLTSDSITVSKTGYTWPCPGNYTLTSLWNEDRSTYNHGAIDIGAGYGSQVVAAYDGTVIDVFNGCSHNWGKSSSCGCGGGYGNYVMIDHGNGKMTIYGHLTTATAEIGEKVKTGQTIGFVGSTGNSTGPHLHFECRLGGVKYNPMLEYAQ